MLSKALLRTVLIIAAVACLPAGCAYYRLRADRKFFDPARLLSRFPVEDAAVFSADFSALREAGFLDESKAALEPDYKKFVESSGFDYKRDLYSVTAAFSGSGNYYIARGTFNWKKLREYAAASGGSCYQDLCRMPGSTPERHISFIPIRNDVMALAVSSNDLAASKMVNAGEPVSANLPVAPVWLVVPGSRLQGRNALPAGLRGMFTGLEKTDRVVVTLGKSGEGVEAKMEASCRTTADAAVLASQLRLAASTLRDALAAQNKSDDIAAMLKAGTFEENGSRVIGRWPLPRTLVDSLTAGI